MSPFRTCRVGATHRRQALAFGGLHPPYKNSLSTGPAGACGTVLEEHPTYGRRRSLPCLVRRDPRLEERRRQVIGDAVDLVFQLAEERDAAVDGRADPRRDRPRRASAAPIPTATRGSRGRSTAPSRAGRSAGAGSAWIVSTASPSSPGSNVHESWGSGRPSTTWRKKAPRPLIAQSRFLSRPWPALGSSTRYFGPLQVVPVEVQRVERPVAVVGAVDQQLGLGQPVAVGVRVDHLPELRAGRASRPSPSAPARRSRGSARCTGPRP